MAHYLGILAVPFVASLVIGWASGRMNVVLMMVMIPIISIVILSQMASTYTPLGIMIAPNLSPEWHIRIGNFILVIAVATGCALGGWVGRHIFPPSILKRRK